MKLVNYSLFFCLSMMFLVFFSSCSKDDPTAPLPLPAPPTIAGAWSGALTQSGVSGSFVLNLSQDVTHFSGSGTLGAISVTISGQNNYPNVTFTGSPAGYQAFSFVGQFTSLTQITGLVNGSGFVNATVILIKN
jgi:hypothetical protein